MIVLIGNTKGGVGKSTLAVQIALRRAMQGKRVWLIDGDRQATSVEAIALRDDAPIKTDTITDGRELVTAVQRRARHVDDVIIDVGGRDSTALRGAMTAADTMIVPFLPSSADVWALHDVIALLKAAGGRVKAYGLLNGADAHTAAEAVKAAEEMGLPVLKSLVGTRRAFRNATNEGLSVWETPSRHRNKQACQELDAVIAEIWA